MANITVNGFMPTKIAEALRHPDTNSVALVLEDAQSERLALILDRPVAEMMHSAILQWLPQGDGEEFGLSLAKDLAAVEPIDHVAVTTTANRLS